jgi:hypothetical protein
MLWIIAILMAGVGYGYVTMRRKRKGQPTVKRAA